MALPLVLGGITLAAIGYGLKKRYGQEDDPWGKVSDDIGEILDRLDDKINSGFDKLEEYLDETSKDSYAVYIPSEYQEKLRSFQNEYLKPYRALLSQIQHTSAQLKPEILLTEHTVLSDNFTGLKKQFVVVQCNLIDDIQLLMSRHLRELESMYNVSDDYLAYKEAAKNKVDQAIQLANAANKLLKFNFLDKDVPVEGNTVKSFRKVTTLVTQLKEEM